MTIDVYFTRDTGTLNVNYVNDNDPSGTGTVSTELAAHNRSETLYVNDTFTADPVAAPSGYKLLGTIDRPINTTLTGNTVTGTINDKGSVTNITYHYAPLGSASVTVEYWLVDSVSGNKIEKLKTAPHVYSEGDSYDVGSECTSTYGTNGQYTLVSNSVQGVYSGGPLSTDQTVTIELYYTANSYDFTVHYVNGHTGETLGEDVRGSAPYGTALNETLVGTYLENSGWLNAHRPSGYNSGSASYITISADSQSNVIIVTYKYSGGGGGDDDNPTYYTVHYQFSGNHPDVTLPSDETYASGTTVQVADGYDDVTTADGVWSFGGWSKTGDFKVTGSTTITGKWTYTPNETSIDEEEPPLSENPPTEQPGEVEVVDEETPLGNLPQTGTTQADVVKPMWTLAMMALAFSMVSAGLTITFTRKKEEEHNED